MTLNLSLDEGSEAVRILDSGDRYHMIEIYQHKFYLFSVPRLGRTPLHYAASQKTGLSYITNLLKAGANIDAQDHSGMTPLHLACRFLPFFSSLWINTDPISDLAISH